MTKAYFAYIRVSTSKQGEHGVSLTEQKGAIEAYAVRHGLMITKWFEERETAAKRGRKVFAQLLREIRARKAQGLVIHKIDRSARNLRDWADIEDLLERGADVRFVVDNVDLASTSGRLSADILAAVAANYVRNLREEVKKGMYGRLKQGVYPWRAPLGYLDQGGGKPKIIDPINGPLVRQLFKRYASNTVSIRTLRHEMFAKGLKTRAGKALLITTVSRILNNPFYCGVIKLRTRGDTFSGIHEPLISKALFERVQLILDGKTVPKVTRHQFLFRGMVHCRNCGRRTLTGERQKGASYYRCHGEFCSGVSWRQDDLEDAVLRRLSHIRFGDSTLECGDGTASGFLGDMRDFRDFVEDICREREGDRARRLTSLNLRLQQTDTRITKLTDLLLDDVIDKETFYFRKEKLLLERRGIAEALENADGRSPVEVLFEEFERNNRELLRYESMLDAEKQQMLQIICSNFSVTANSLSFTLRSPYKEIAESAVATECGHFRDDVRTRTVITILKNYAERQLRSPPYLLYQVPEVPQVPDATLEANADGLREAA